MPTNQQIEDADSAKADARTEIYKQIQRVAASTEDLTDSVAAEALKDLAEAFAWVTSTAQPH